MQKEKNNYETKYETYYSLKFMLIIKETTKIFAFKLELYEEFNSLQVFV